MGQDIDQEDFSAEDFERYAKRLEDGLSALHTVLERPDFGKGPPSVGAELEFFLVDAAGDPLGRNEAVLEAAPDERLTVELNRFNLECNASPRALAGRPFQAMRAELEQLIARLREGARSQDGRVVMVGILPTLRESDFQEGADTMTDVARFRALSASVRRLRQQKFDIRIDGPEPLEFFAPDVTVEGANTGFQVHLRVEPEAFAGLYNAVQLTTAPVLAAAANSPIFLGHRLWHETRIALFKQSVDERHESWDAWRPPRVSLGNGWVRESAFELFQETVALHAPLLPVCSDEDPIACAREGGVPQLDEVRLHHGTVWRWNRGIYDPKGDGHLRVEMRSLPAGPTVVDMTANAAFHVGLALGLEEEADWMTTALPFKYAERNLYRAAQHGLSAMLLWPSRKPPSPRPMPVSSLILELLPVARRGLERGGVDAGEIDDALAVIEERVRSKRTGSEWQLARLAKHDERLERPDALRAMLADYLEAQAGGKPVHEWAL
ncbi:MAG: glutamate--cysteine ligase [Myxococcales bacterium]|nr:glutamate--cysteine ligase [Myxococcales bacterium]